MRFAKRIDPTSVALITLALLMLVYANGCAMLGGQPLTQSQRLIIASETYSSTVEFLATAANAGLIDEADKPKIRAVRLQADALLTAAEQVDSEGGDISVSLDSIEKLIDDLIAERAKAERKAKGQ